jgi:hypothetical protein
LSTSLSLDSCINKLIEVFALDQVDSKLDCRIEASAKLVLLPLIGGDLITCIASKVGEGSAVGFHIHISLCEPTKLLTHLVHGTITNVMTPEKRLELIPTSLNIWISPLQVAVPPRSRLTSQEEGHKGNSVCWSYTRGVEGAVHLTQPIICI